MSPYYVEWVDFYQVTIWLEIKQTDRCCSETESVTAQICSGRNRTEPHSQIRASRRRPPWWSASRSQARR